MPAFLPRSLPRLIVPALLLLSATGCIRSRAIVNSDPPGAMVTWNNQYRGRTPIEIPYTWYWKYKVDVKKEGYQPTTQTEKFRTPPWAVFPMDLFAEALPFNFTDTREINVKLEPEKPM